MKDLIELGFEVQIMLVAGYLALIVSDKGLKAQRTGIDELFRVLGFGSLAFLGWKVLVFIGPFLGVTSLSRWQPDLAFLIKAAVFTVFGIAAGAIWRVCGRRAFAAVMGWFSVYRDDHSTSTLASIAHSGLVFTTAQVIMTNGRICESDFGLIPADAPFDPLTINDDGVAIYVTAVYSENDEKTDIDPNFDAEQGIMRLRYIPHSAIEQIEWFVRKPTPSASWFGRYF